jgi:electron transport complex protein RnfC
MSRGFKGGVILPAGKTTRDLIIDIMPQPKIVYLPLAQYSGQLSRPVVDTGAEVQVGDLVAAPVDDQSVGVHASIRGRVREIAEHPHPRFGKSLCCVIEAVEGGAGERIREKAGYEHRTADELRAILRDLGVVGMGGAGFPTGVKLSPPPGKGIDTLIVNGCESEPLISADYRLMVEYPMGVIEGARIFQQIVGARRLIVAVAESLRSIAETFKKEGVEVHRLKWKFPLGSEKQLIHAVLNRTVPRCGLPWDAGCVVQNVATCYAGFQAVVFRKPVVERVVTVAGDGVKEPKNLMVRIGTAAREIINYCGGYTGTPAIIIFGGPMTGRALPTDRIPVTKETTAVLVLAAYPKTREQPCVRCARCIDVCPMGLMPCEIYRRITVRDYPGSDALGLADCLECGGCAYSCPSRIALVHYFRYGKAELRGEIPA